MNKRHYEHTLPNIRGSLSNTYVEPYKIEKIMALEIKGLQRIFKFKKDSKELVLSDPDSSLSVNEVMDFYSMTYPELTTATVHGPEWEEDKAVYRFKTTIGVKG